MSTEMIRRTIRIRIDTGSEQPWTRDPTSFRHADLRSWASERRADLVAACLTIVSAWIAEGNPAGSATLGMFEDWARVMSGLLEVVGVHGFLANAAEFYEAMAEDDQAFAAFVAVWAVKFPDKAVGVAELHAIAVDHLDLGSGTDRSQRTHLGNILRKNRDRRFGDYFVKRMDPHQGAAQWRLTGPPS
jgi:putative DNA primase/helicase